MADGDRFFSRWSQKKTSEKKHGALAEALPRTANLPLRPSDGKVGEKERAHPEGRGPGAAPVAQSAADIEKLIASLPSIESLTAGTDLSVYLARGVPDALRNAALRRVWALDPKVRDFVSEALDYGYDWNAAGGVPGYGPISAADHLLAHLPELSLPQIVEKPVEQAEKADSPDERPKHIAAAKPPEPAPAQALTAVPAHAPRALADPAPDAATASPQPRRHGGALPG